MLAVSKISALMEFFNPSRIVLATYSKSFSSGECSNRIKFFMSMSSLKIWYLNYEPAQLSMHSSVFIPTAVDLCTSKALKRSDNYAAFIWKSDRIL